VPSPDFIINNSENSYHFHPDGHFFPNAAIFCSYPNPELDNLTKFKSGKPKVTNTEYDYQECYKRGKELQEEWISWMPSWFYSYRAPTKKSLSYLKNIDKVLLYIKPEEG